MDDIIDRINAALKRMEEEGALEDNYIHYERLKAKRDAILEGKPYCTYNVAPYLISYIGSHIPDCNMAMDNKQMTSRGDKKEATIQAVNNAMGY